MDWAYQYRDPERLYLNVTNRCTNRCSFCVRSRTSRLGDGLLIGDDEPNLEQLLAAVGDRGGPGRFKEIVWCGYGEPTIRLDLILDACPIFRDAGARIRINTNGHACLIHGRDVLPELGDMIDRVNVSLNAPTVERYIELCEPDLHSFPWKPLPAPEAFWKAMTDFLRRAPNHFSEVQASVVGHTLDADEIERCRRLAEALAGASLRVR